MSRLRKCLGNAAELETFFCFVFFKKPLSSRSSSNHCVFALIDSYWHRTSDFVALRPDVSSNDSEVTKERKAAVRQQSSPRWAVIYGQVCSLKVK